MRVDYGVINEGEPLRNKALRDIKNNVNIIQKSTDIVSILWERKDRMPHVIYRAEKSIARCTVVYVRVEYIK